MLFNITQALGEMAIVYPISGGFYSLVVRMVNPALGCALRSCSSPRPSSRIFSQDRVWLQLRTELVYCVPTGDYGSSYNSAVLDGRRSHRRVDHE
jgi:hypothetical protein